MSFVAELQRRNVFKVAAAYAVVGWLLAQAAAVALPTFGAPDWALRTAIFCLLLGFPVALVLAWALELTPEGVQIASGTVGNKRFYGSVLVLVALTLAWLAQPVAPVRRAATGAAMRSIAVLPFVDLSPTEDQEYFSDGISEEILNSLAKLPELRVAARTSSFKFRGGDRDIPEIANELHVVTVLEGSVRRQGNRVRITAQLIDAATGFHLWSETYDRELNDIFAVQDEIATAIASALQIELGVTTRPPAQAAAPLQLEGYDLYLKGMQAWHLRNEADLRKAAALFEAAIVKDPGSARAHAGLAMTYAILPYYSREPSEASHIKASAAAERVLELDPNSAEAHAVLGFVARDDHRFASAVRLLRQAITLNPSFATAYQWLGSTYFASGDLGSAEYELRKALELDPASRAIRGTASWIVRAGGRHREALDICRVSVARDPENLGCHHQIMQSVLALGDLATAREAMSHLARGKGPAGAGLVERVLAVAAGKGDADAVARELMAFDGRSYFDPASASFFVEDDLPVVFARLERPGEARLGLQRMARQRDTAFERAYWDVALDSIACEPEMRAEALRRGALAERVKARCARASGKT